MSADKRKTILIGFAGLAVVLVAVIAIVSPQFRSEDASGAIGAVQKHHAPQIVKADVILGDEQTRNAQRVQYADFLNDAAALRNMSDNFTAASHAREAKAQYNAMDLGIKARSKDVGSRFYNSFDEALVGVRSLAESDSAALGAKQTAMIAEIDALGAKAKARNLASEDMQNLSSRLVGLAKQAGSHASLDQKANTYAGHAATIAEARSNLAAAQASLASRNLAANVRANVSYAESMAREAAALDNADHSLASLGQRQASLDNEALLGAGARLREEAAGLEARAIAGMKSAMENAAENYDTLGQFAQSVESFKQDGSFARDFASLENMRANAANRANAEAYAQLGAINARMQSADTLNAKLQSEYQEQVGALSRLSGNAAYASMFRNSDDFATQVRALSNTTLNSAKRNMDSLNSAKKNAAALDNSKK
jgi:hypothetical protein